MKVQDRSTKAGRGAGGRREAAAARIRAGIINGRFPSGSQLPTFNDLIAEHNLSRATMQLVIRQLKDEGFVRSVDRSGLFVAEFPPHRYRFGLALPSAPGEAGWDRFLGALLSESTVVSNRQEGVEIVPFFGLHPEASKPALDTLLTDCAAQRLAGIIITRGTGFLLHHPLVRQLKTPCVAINHLVTESAGAPVVNTDDPGFMTRALDWLVHRGRKRVAVIAMRPNVSEVATACAEAGLAFRPHWLCPISLDHRGQVKVIVRLLLDYPKSQRPDCLVVATDNLVEEALSAIHESGIVIGRDIDVVAHCNWPWPVESPLPIARLGFHSHEFLNQCLDTIRALRAGKTPPELSLIPALFDNEIQ